MEPAQVMNAMGPGGIAALLVYALVEVGRHIGAISSENARKAAAGVALILAPILLCLTEYGRGQTPTAVGALLTWGGTWAGSMGLHDALSAVWPKKPEPHG